MRVKVRKLYSGGRGGVVEYMNLMSEWVGNLWLSKWPCAWYGNFLCGS